ncbi:MAG: tetratricopeptide repeat protein [Caulobacteraceae bacterium]
MRALILAVSLAAFSAGATNAAVTVFGSDSATQCSQAAIAGKSDLASEQYCTRALQEDTLDTEDRAGTFVNRGVMKLRRKEFEASHADFNAALALAPNMAEAWVNRGAMWDGEGQYQAALDDLTRSIQLGVKEPEKAYFDRALAYEGLDNEKAAYFDYEKALELKPDWQLPQHELLRFHVTRVATPG